MTETVEETLLEVTWPDGYTRRGLLTHPAHPTGIAIVLLPAGLKYQVGPGRLNVRLARFLAERGYLVLRFDPLGIGESDGRLPIASVNEVWNEIGRGAWVQDTLQICRELRRQFAIRTIVVGGLCGGAITAQLAAASAPALIQGVLSFCTAVTLPEVNPSAKPAVHPTMARHHMRAYRKKLLSPDSWKRLLRGESNLRGILAVVRSQAGRWLGGGLIRQEMRLPNENPFFLSSFRRLQAQGIHHLLLFGTEDNRWAEFQNAVLGPHLGLALQGNFYDVQLIADANHELHLKKWKDEAAILVEKWLKAHFSARPAVEYQMSNGAIAASQQP